jgi:hypothetical protein
MRRVDLEATRDKARKLDSLAAAIEEVLKELYGQRMGFALFMFPFEGDGEAGDWVSNGQRPDMIKFMREIADRLEKGQDIGRPVGEA